MGSTTNIVTWSGSNSFHGAAWEFLRNDAMDSSDFTQSVQPLKQNQFGATFGGPIRKDKTFFFGYYEGFRNRQGETVPATVPSLAERQGNFAEECTDLPGATIDATTGLCSNPAGAAYFLGTPVPFNQMMLFTPIDPTASSALQFFPLRNVGEKWLYGDPDADSERKPVRITPGLLSLPRRHAEFPLHVQQWSKPKVIRTE
jgi:hypothetical protein